MEEMLQAVAALASLDPALGHIMVHLPTPTLRDSLAVGAALPQPVPSVLSPTASAKLRRGSKPGLPSLPGAEERLKGGGGGEVRGAAAPDVESYSQFSLSGPLPSPTPISAIEIVRAQNRLGEKQFPIWFQTLFTDNFVTSLQFVSM